MKIALILTTFPCGSETFVVREIEGLQRLGFDVTVLAGAPGRSGDEHICRVKTVYKPRRFSVGAVVSAGYLVAGRLPALGRLLRLIVKVLLSCPREALSLIGNLATIGCFARRLDREGISHIHAYFLSWPASIGMALSAVCGAELSISAHARDIFVEHGAVELKVRLAGFVRVCTRQGLKRLKTLVPARYHYKLRLVHHGIRIACGGVNPRRNSFHPSKRGTFVIGVGRLVGKKGFANLLKAFALVARRDPGLRLIIVGDGPEREHLDALAGQLKVKSRVDFPGWKRLDETLQLLATADLLAAPSIVDGDGDSDGLPNVILEAFACGVPVVASNLDGIAEAVKHRQTGLLVAPADVAGLAAAMEELLKDKDLQCRLSEKARQTVVRRFDLTKNVRQLAWLCKRANR